MTVGNMGSEFRIAYTVMGDEVNLGSRLEGLTRTYEVGVVVSESTMAAVPEFAYRELDRVGVKGRDKPVTIYEPLGLQQSLDAETQDELSRYQQALGFYRLQNWEAAQRAFESLSRQRPDRTLYRIYLERIAIYQSDPPGQGWDGVFRHEHK
jgi:adenylate cyclase